MSWTSCNTPAVNCGIVGWDVHAVIERAAKVAKSTVFNFIRIVLVASCYVEYRELGRGWLEDGKRLKYISKLPLYNLKKNNNYKIISLIIKFEGKFSENWKTGTAKL